MIDQIEALVVHTEAEALLAEQNFIKQYKPRFNIRLRDDKSYPYIAISLDEDFPRVYFTRERHRRDRAYFGPYQQRQAGPLDARGARQGVHVPLLRGPRARAAAAARRAWTTTSSAARRRASATSTRRSTGAAIDGVIAFLSGRYREIERALEQSMQRGRRPSSASRTPRASATGCARSARCSSASGSPTRRSGRSTRSPSPSARGRGQRAGVPGPRRRPVRPPELLPRQRGRGRDRPRSPRRSSSSTTPAR